ncbi:MAG TPA: imidazoleglycerol-phosphate dehydratase, partial [Nitrospiraceae bacterium]|nr:imidazoleglycerol-phosphate dehydratase [Nitrospiraceae bacterium]
MSQQPVPRTASQERKTAETAIRVQWGLDGCGTNQIKTSIPFLDHMLNLFGKHGFFDLTVEAKGDIEIDDHHTIEDVGIVMGQVLTKALGTKEGIS